MANLEPRAQPKSRRDRQIEEVRHDPYLARSKPAEPAWCPSCGLVYHAGRWQRAERPSEPHRHFCPACLRLRDDFPAGIVTLSGDFDTAQREALLGLARRAEASEAAEHPLQRIMAVRVSKAHTVITTTDPHLAQRIGSTISHARGGRLTIDYSDDEYLVRVDWSAAKPRD